MTNNDRASRIAALLATAESYAREGNEQAAATYTAKASELQLKYMIEDSDIRKAGAKPTDELDRRLARGVNKGAAYIKARRDIVVGLANIFNVRVTIAHDRSSMTLLGFASDLDFVQQVFDSLSLQLDSALARVKGDRSYKTSFAHGFAHRVIMRLRDARTDQVADADSSTPGTALVLADRRAIVASYFAEQFAGVKMGSSYKNRSVRSAGGFYAGDAAGRVADIGGAKIGRPTRGQLPS